MQKTDTRLGQIFFLMWNVLTFLILLGKHVVVFFAGLGPRPGSSGDVLYCSK